MAIRKIVDCFTFYNEIDLLLYRLTILYDVVDYFVIVEANQTYTGKSKELFYAKNAHLFENFLDKIIHIVVDLPFIYPAIDIKKGEQWTNENYQRNCIANGIQKIPLCDDDFIIISDLDEIPSPDVLMQIKRLEYIQEQGFQLSLHFYYYNLNTRHYNDWNFHTKMVSFKKYKTTTPQEIRTTLRFPIIQNAGWHLSYFGDSAFIKNKLENFSHQEYNSDVYTSLENISNRVSNTTDLFGRTNVPMRHIKIEENNFLPPQYNLYLTKFYNT
jgi:beta-1,4-mannosyl-glycoprotein beta-1,4-N-acetylglucosaminyltransferase